MRNIPIFVFLQNSEHILFHIYGIYCVQIVDAVENDLRKAVNGGQAAVMLAVAIYGQRHSQRHGHHGQRHGRHGCKPNLT